MEMIYLVISNEPWGDMWFIKHRYAIELSRSYKVYFINPVTKWHPRNLLKPSFEWEKYNENLTIVSYNNPLPLRINAEMFTRINDVSFFRRFKKAFNHSSAELFLWQFDPFRFIEKGVHFSKRFYHAADPLNLLGYDGEIAKQSDAVLCTSEKYMDHYSSLNKQVEYVPHCISKDELSLDEKKVAFIQKEYGSFILFIGLITHLVDLNIFKEIAKKYPDKNVVLIGKTIFRNTEEKAAFEALTSITNIKYLGQKKGDQLKEFIRCSEACIVAYRFDYSDSYGKATNSHKVTLYLAQEKNIISNLDIEMPEFKGKFIHFADSMNAYLKVLEEQLNQEHSKEDTLTLKNYLYSIQYHIMIENLLDRFGR